LLLRRGAVAVGECEALSKLSTDLAKANLNLVLHVPDSRHGCAPDSAYRVDSPRNSASSIAIDDVGPDIWRAVIVDTSGFVRIVRDIRTGGLGLKEAHELASTWEAGRLSFITNCGHCHGDDGSDRSYPNIKTMAGISTRMKPDRILEGGQDFGAVDTASWTASLKEAVLLYIEGL
jgi:hypothetical protein